MPDESPRRLLLIEPLHGPQLLAHERPGRGLLVVGIDLVQRPARDLVVDPLAAQLVRQRAPRQPLAGWRRLDPGPGERLVVDQADLGEPVEQALGQLARHVLLRQLVGQLLAGARLTGQGVEQDLARHRLRIGVRSLRHLVGRWRGRGRPSGARAGSTHDHGIGSTDAPACEWAPARTARPGSSDSVEPDFDNLDERVQASTPAWTSPAHAGAGRSSPTGAGRPAGPLRSHSRRSARRRGRPRECRPADRHRASPGSSSPARWPGRGCP